MAGWFVLFMSKFDFKRAQFDDDLMPNVATVAKSVTEHKVILLYTCTFVFDIVVNNLDCYDLYELLL